MRSDGKSTVYEPSVDKERVIATYSTFTALPSGGVVSLNAASGAIEWQAPFPKSDSLLLGTNTNGSLVVTSDSVIAPIGNGRIVALDKTNGHVRWMIPKLTGVPEEFGPAEFDIRPVATDGRLLISGSLFGYVSGYDVDTAQEIWRYDGAANGSIVVDSTVDDRTVYVPYVVHERDCILGLPHLPA